MNLDPLCIPAELQKRIDAACDRFEESWRQGSMPRVEDYLVMFNSNERPTLLTALQKRQFELALGQSTKTDSAPPPDTQQIQSFIQLDSDFEISEVSDDAPIDLAANIPHVIFRVIEGPHAGKSFRFTQHDTLFAGRLSIAQLRLEKDLHFSRHHFRLEVNPPTCFLMDLNSRNGTYVNGDRVKEIFLRNGDIVSGGRTKMAVSIHDPNSSNRETVREDRAKHQKNNLVPGGEVFHLHESGSFERHAESNSPPRLSPGADIRKPTIIAIDGFQVFEQIGSGDLGVVYRAMKLTTKEPCALKVFEPAVHSDAASIQTFLREASVLKQLQHPHIIRLIDMGSSGRNIFLATEYLDTIDWSQLALRYSPEKRIRVACGLMSQILGAMEYAHARSFVHRDVKPGNILIAKHEGKLIAKLADFGLAKQYTTAGMSQVTRDGDVLGSLPFMSPDQFLNSRDARPACDLYSAGAALYWMLTGKEPIPLEGYPCKFLAILEAPPTPIRQYNPAIPEVLASLVTRALEKTPEKRFSSATEMKHHLKQFLDSWQTQPFPPISNIE